jgi:signal transduction histidine kinase
VRASRPRTVATRLLASYVVVLLAFAAASAWSVRSLRVAVEEAALLREGYLPLALSLRDLVASQDTWNSQLNHITDARNPADKRAWFETALGVGRPSRFRQVEAALARAFAERGEAAALTHRELGAEVAQVRRMLDPDAARVARLFAALERQDRLAAEQARDELVREGLRAQRALRSVEGRVGDHVESLVREAAARERLALGLLVLVGAATLLIGVLMALYARRVVSPLSLVTRRAQAVARGELTVQRALGSPDEIGELSRTFEGMVEAIAAARERVLASERLAAIGKMAAHVTHEIRNPLSSIALNLDLLEEELAQARDRAAELGEARALLGAIGQEVQRLSVLSDQYLSMARRKPPELEECELLGLVRDAGSFMRPDLERSGVTLEVEGQEGLPLALVDPAQLRQVLFNLVRNAREALPEGGHVWLRVALEGEALTVGVEDDGPGVPPQRVAQLFDPFFTTKDHGTGLGLAVSRQILLAHGGGLDYSPRGSGGSCFTARLPVLKPAGLTRVEAAELV